jgi:hypothetical protein
MAADLAPAPFQQWSFEKAQAREDSPVSDRSADFYDAEDKLRISPTMNEIRAALNATSPVFNNKEYLSSEEALSPVMDEEPELSEAEELEEVVEIESEELTEVDLWEGIKVFALDIAITLSMQFVGPPKVIDLHMPSYSHDADFHVAPLRFDSLPPKSERRTQVRTLETPPVLTPRYSGSSLDALCSPSAVTEIFTDSPETLHSRFSGSSYTESPVQSPTTAAPTKAIRSSSEYAESIKSLRRNGSIFSVAEQNISANWTPPLSEEETSSPASSFLQSDPFDSSSQPKPTHNRVRSISSRFPKFSFGGKKEGKTDEERAQKKDRRNSFFRPSTPTSAYDSMSPMASRDSIRSSESQPSFIAPLSTASMPRRMVPRGADERASPISLPPCPDNFSPPSPELLRSNTIFAAPIIRKPLGSAAHMKRRRSMLGLG